jgi:predicted amidohydrolase
MTIKKITFLQVDNTNIPNPAKTIEWVCDQINSIKFSNLILLPELWVYGAFNFDQKSVSFKHQQLLNELIELLKNKCDEAHLGSYVVNDKGFLRNRSYFLNNTNGQIYKYDKRRLFGFGTGESELFAAGETPCLTEGNFQSHALTTCYDLRFPEIFSESRIQGATSFICTAGWPLSRIEHWKALSIARAIENQAYFFGCNASGVSGDSVLGGNSIVVNPNGEVLFLADSNPGVYHQQIEFKHVSKWRKAFPIHEDC